MSKGRRLIGLLCAIAAGVGGATLTGAGPAAAAVPGLVRIAATSASNSNDSKSVTAFCPTGKVAIGTGYSIAGATGEVIIDDLRPDAGSVTVLAYEADPLAGNWTVTAFAVCADPLPGLVRISATGVSDSLDFKNVTAACPSGRTLLGTGFAINGANGEVTVDDFRPNGSTTTAPTSISGGAYETEALASNWSLTVFGVCATARPGQTRGTATSASNSSDKGVTVTCPGTDVLTGTGFEVLGATGDVVVDELRPNGSATTAPDSNFVFAYEEDPLATNWTVTSYGICADA